jgi:ACT domain-containing protein
MVLTKMIKIECNLPDRPGSLIELIRPISNNHGNIYGILHYHDKKLNNMVPVSVSFELPEELIESSLKKIQIELEEKDIEIVKITFGPKQRQLIVILTGHVFDTDVVDTIKRLASKNIKVPELQAKFTEISEVSNVKLKLSYPDSMKEEELIKELELICKEKNLFLIRS